MKLVIAIVNRDDAAATSDALRDGGFHFTRLASSGGFLKSSNETILCGVPDERCGKAVETIREHCRNRTKTAPETMSGLGFFPSAPVDLKTGGAAIFVVDVERFERV